MEQLMLDLIPTGAKAVCHVSQNDIGRTIRFNLTSGGTAYTLAGTETIKVYIKKPDGTTAERNIANTSSTYVDWVTGEGDCDVAGKNECELVITAGPTVIGSKNFTMKVEEDPYNGQGVVIETAGPAPVATFDTNIVDLFVEIKCEINPLQDLHGYDHPWIGGSGSNKFSTNNCTISGLAYGLTISKNGERITVAGTSTTTMENAAFQLLQLADTSMSGLGYSIQLFNVEGTQPKGVYGLRTENEKAIAIIFELTEGQVVNSSFNLSVSPTTQTEWSPYENICPIVGHSELNLVRCGKNLYSIEQGAYDQNMFDGSGNIVHYPDINLVVLPVESGSTYSFMFGNTPSSTTYIRIAYVDNNGGFISREGPFANTQFPMNKTMPNNCKYIQLQINENDAAHISDNDWLFGVIKGSDMPYETYNGTTYLVQFGQTVYGGVVDVSKRKLRVTLNYINLGDLNWSKTNFSEFRASYAGNNIPLPNYISDTTVINGLCECYPVLTAVQTYKGLNTGISAADDYFSVGDDNYSTAADFKAAMNNMYFAYELATPIEIDVSALSVETLMGNNNLWHDCNGDTEVKYLYNA